MFGFPIGNGNAGFNDFVEKFTNNADSGFPKIQQREVFYSIRGGNWNDTTVWQTTSGRLGILPTSIDDVYIRHDIIGNTITTINNLFIRGSLSVTVGINITFNNIRCYGALINNAGTFRILGNENYIEKSLYQFINGSIEYQGNNQPILDLNYGNLTLSSAGTKYLTQDLIVNGNFLLSSPATFDAYGYNITINGTTTINSTMNATGSGSYLFIGLVSFPTAGLNFVGNPTMEFRGGLGFGSGTYTSNTGAGNITFTTNNQSVTSATNGLFFNNAISIASGLTLTFSSNTTTTFNSTINGLSGTSKLVNSGGSNLVFTTQSGCENLMSTGIYDFTTSANTITFGGNYSATIPSYFTNFHNLTISGTGTKTLGVNTTLNANLLLQGVLSTTTSGILQCSTFNLTVTGTTTISSGSLLKSGAGNILFIGALIAGVGYNTNTINLSGNPNVELRGGITGNTYGFSVAAGGLLSTGIGTWTFTTNNQSVTLPISSFSQTFDCVIIVSGAIIITWTALSTINNYIDGNNASSQFRLGVSSTTTYRSATQPMATGILDTQSNLNTWIYGSGSQDIKGDPTPLPGKQIYRNLTLNGGGVKTLQGYVSVQNTYTLTAPATLALNGFTLTNP